MTGYCKLPRLAPFFLSPLSYLTGLLLQIICCIQYVISVLAGADERRDLLLDLRLRALDPPPDAVARSLVFSSLWLRNLTWGATPELPLGPGHPV